MRISYSARPLIALPLMAPLFGCADKPVHPIVLRPAHSDRTAVHRSAGLHSRATRAARATLAPASAATQAPSPAPASELSPEQKEKLYQDFDDYLSQPERH